MGNRTKVSLPALGPVEHEAKRRIVDWWTALRLDGNAGETTWEVLESLEGRVTDALSSGDIQTAHHLTARAWMLFEGMTES